jgi:multiple sugar transport system permease protein
MRRALSTPLKVVRTSARIPPSFALFALYLAMLNKAQTRFVGLANFQFPFGRELFWMLVKQVVIFAVTAVFFQAILGSVAAHLVNNLPQKGQRKRRGMVLVRWVIPPALSTLGWWWMFDPTTARSRSSST